MCVFFFSHKILIGTHTISFLLNQIMKTCGKSHKNADDFMFVCFFTENNNNIQFKFIQFIKSRKNAEYNVILIRITQQHKISPRIRSIVWSDFLCCYLFMYIYLLTCQKKCVNWHPIKEKKKYAQRSRARQIPIEFFYMDISKIMCSVEVHSQLIMNWDLLYIYMYRNVLICFEIKLEKCCSTFNKYAHLLLSHITYIVAAERVNSFLLFREMYSNLILSSYYF